MPYKPKVQNLNLIKEQARVFLNLYPEYDFYWDVIDVKLVKLDYENLLPSEKIHINESLIEKHDDDYYPGLVLCHYNESYSPLNRALDCLKMIRGIVLDFFTGSVIAVSNGNTENLYLQNPIRLGEKEYVEPDNETKNIYQTLDLDVLDKEYINDITSAPDEVPLDAMKTLQVPINNSKLYIGFEGVLIRLFKWRGEIYFSTHKRIEAYNSHWEGRDNFWRLFKKLIDFDIEELFNDEEYFSPYCYMFLITDNAVRLTSSIIDNRIVYLGFKQCWEPLHMAFNEYDPYYTSDESINNLSNPTNVKKLLLNEKHSEPISLSGNINRPTVPLPEVDYNMGNKFIFPSFFAGRINEGVGNQMFIDYNDNKEIEDIYFNQLRETNDPRLMGGDFLMLYAEHTISLPIKDENGDIITVEETSEVTVYKLYSPGYRYRHHVMNNEPNIYFKFVENVDTFLEDTEFNEINSYPEYNNIQRLGVSKRRVFLWQRIISDCVSPFYRDEAKNMGTKLSNEINQVANFVLSKYRYLKLEEKKQKFVKTSGKKAVDNYNKILHKMYEIKKIKGNRKNDKEILVDLIYEQKGSAIHNMVKETKRYEKFFM